MKKTKKGFTLIELMIVVAIIGVLASVAIPKFADLIRKATEAACKGQLGSMRSALSIYYGNEEGFWPTDLDGTSLTPTYIQSIPEVNTGARGAGVTNDVTVETDGAIGDPLSAAGGWWYNSGVTSPNAQHVGTLKVRVTMTDTRGIAIHLW